MSTLAAWLLAPFAGRPAMISLAPLSVLAGIGMLWVFGRTSNQQAIAGIKARIQAHLYEMRLFTDEPSLIWEAQWGLLKANARYIGMMLAPALAMSVPMILLFSQLECFYGHAPLEPGQSAIVTMQLKQGEAGPAPALRAPEGIVVESPGVRIDGGRQISWRIRALRPATGDLEFIFPHQALAKSIQAGGGIRYLSERRVRSVANLIWYPAESRLPVGQVDWIELRYPSATVRALGLNLHWLIWFVILSMLSALLLKRHFRVSF